MSEIREDLIGYDVHARERIETLEAALAKYARHLDSCDISTAFASFGSDQATCTCGLRRALEKP